MKVVRKIYHACVLFVAGVALTSTLTPSAASSRSHHGKHPSAHVHPKAKTASTSAHERRLARLENKKHLQRLAAKEHAKHEHVASNSHHKSAEYRAHLKRAAQKAHEARLQAKHEKSPAWRAHLKRLAHAQHLANLAANRIAAHKLKIHNIRLAKLKVHVAKAHRRTEIATAHAAKLARLVAQRENQARYQAHLANIAAAHRARVHQREQAHLARLAAHQARLAEQQAWAAQKRARRLEQEADNRLSSAYGITRWGTYTDGVPVQVVLVDLNKPQIKVSALLSRDGIGSSEPFSAMIQRSHPKVAVTGTFFSLDNLRPIGDIVIDGNLAYFGGMGTALCITPANYADMITVPWGHHHDWTGYDCVVACGPRLLKDGSIWLDPHAERFKDQHMLAPNSRIAVGITPGNKLLFAMTRDRIYLGKLAKVMRDLGCSQAMNLDAGTSTGFYCNGQMLARPGRRLTNAIVVQIKQPSQTSSAAVEAAH